MNPTPAPTTPRDSGLDARLYRAPISLSSQPVYAFLVQFPAVCFSGAWVSDIAYAQTVNYLWETFSIWLLTAGCIFAGLTGIAGLVIYLRDRSVRAAHLAGPYAIICLLVLVLSIFNAFIHSRDGYTAVVPTGLALSSIVVVLMVAATCIGWRRHQLVARGAAA